MSDPYKDVRTRTAVILRITAAVLMVPCLGYGMFLAIDGPSLEGMGSKVHGLVIICLGVMMSRFALNGKTGLTVLDEAMQSTDDER